MDGNTTAPDLPKLDTIDPDFWNQLSRNVGVYDYLLHEAEAHNHPNQYPAYAKKVKSVYTILSSVGHAWKYRVCYNIV